MNRTQIFEWFLKFKSEITFAEDAECLWHPPVSKVVRNFTSIRELVYGNSYFTVNVGLLVCNAVWTCTSSHSVTTLKTNIDIFSVVRTSNLTCISLPVSWLMRWESHLNHDFTT
jgi:hypothetical protein